MSSFFYKFLTNNLDLTSIIVGVGGIFLFLYFAYYKRELRKLSSKRFSPPVLHGITASAQPDIAMEKAIGYIIHGEIATLGELLNFFRGSNNEKIIRLDNTFHNYLQRILDGKSPMINVPLGFEDTQVKEMLRQLCHCADQAVCLEKERATSFDVDNPEHMQLLRELWKAAGKPQSQFSHRSEEWSDLGFQGLDPTTDLRGGGILALRQLLHFAKVHSDEFKAMMTFNKTMLAAGEHSWYLTAVVSIQFTAQLLLQQDHKFYLPQLEVLYDTITARDDGGESDGGLVRYIGAKRPTLLECRGVNRRRGGCSGQSVHSVWREESDFEVGFYTLHHQLLLHFKKCWHRDLPHVMEYGNYMPTVFQSFFVQD